jgi:hypothetical protein
MAANAQAVCNSFKNEVWQAYHNFGTTVTRAGTGADTLKAALYLINQSIGGGTTAYSATGEVSGTGYTAGGIAVTNANPPALTSNTSNWTPSANLVYTSVTLSSAFDCVLIYNSTQSNRSVASFTFGSQTVTGSNFTLTMPTNLMSLS